jgi:hypothetical protein
MRNTHAIVKILADYCGERYQVGISKSTAVIEQPKK